MSSWRAFWPRIAMALVLALLIFVQIQALLGALGSQSRARDRAVGEAERSLSEIRPLLADAVRGRDQARAMAIVAARFPGAALEILDRERRLVAADASGWRATHTPTREEWRGVVSGNVVSVGPVARDGSRILMYIAPAGRAGAWVMRVAIPSPDLVADLKARNDLLAGHIIGLVLLVLAAGLLLIPSRSPADAPSSSMAAEAYETAITRLGARGREITHRFESEKRRLEALVHDREAMARAGELTSGIVHEMRNGLGTILGFARLLKKMTGDAAEHGADIERECRALESMIARFLDFIREESLRPAPFDLARMLSRVIAHECAARPGVNVRWAPSELPAMVGDEDLLERAFENIVRNALEAAGPDGNVHVVASIADDHARVSVSDDGPGFPSDLKELGRPFMTQKPGGVGLGLALAIKLVTLHGGTLTLDRAVKRGAEVVVELPMGSPLVTKSSDREPGIP